MTDADRVLDALLYALPRVSEALRNIEEHASPGATDAVPPAVRRDLILLRASLADAASCIRRIVATLPARGQP